MGNLVELADSDGGISRFTYDERDSLVEARLASGVVGKWSYDDRGHLTRTRILPAAGQAEQVVDYAFDGLDRLRRATQYPS